MEAAFQAFAKFGNAKSDGTTITLSNADKWMKQAGVIDGKKITTTDTGICFNKFKSRTQTIKDFVAYVEELAKEKNIDPDELKSKLLKCTTPGTTNTTQPECSGVVERMTDTSRYTGTQKKRFDESGKGKGLAGREDKARSSGHVGSYRSNDSLEKLYK